MTDPADGGWRRPVPIVGDPSSARERSGDPRGWAFPGPVQDALADVIAARRDIRRFRPDAVPEELLTRVLQAGHQAPSVGHSQPWRFLVVTAQETRDRAAAMADRERLAQAAGLEPERARRLLDLKLEGLREAPIGIVVACDRRAPSAGVLGRATYPDADLWGCACAVENMWLTARAHGLGLGWVTLFRPEELAALVGLPDGVQSLGWLCLGWPDERPPFPGLERQAWSRRLALDDVVVRERWPTGDEPAAPISFLRAPSPAAVVAATDAADQLLTPPGSLGVLDRVVDRVLAQGGPPVTGGTLVLVGADHPVRTLGVSAFTAGTTREVLRAAVAGQALGVVSARTAGLDTIVVDAGVDDGAVPGALSARPRGPRGDLAATDALDADDVTALIAYGRQLGDRAAATGLVALGEVGLGNTTVAAAMTALLLDLDPAATVGLGSGADAAMLRRKQDVVTAACARARSVVATDQDDSATGTAEWALTVLRCVGGPEFAVLTGVTLGAAEAGAGVVLDGLATSVAALVAARLEPAVTAYLFAGHVSREQAHRPVLTALGLEPLLDLRLRAGEGAGACLAAGLVLGALAIRRDTARVNSGAGPGPAN